MADSKKYNGSTWEHSLRKLSTSTDTFTSLPADLYADGNNATVGLKGNMQQTGTGTPSNPIQPSECGERTENLFDATIEQGSITSSGDIPADNRIRTREFINIESEYITLSWSSEQNTEVYIMMYDTNGDYVRMDGWTTSPTTYQLLSTIKKIRIIWRYESQADITPSAITNIMLNSGSTSIPYEPYGYKIPISSANTTTPVYLGEVQSTRKIGKLVLTGSETFFRDKERTDSWRFYSDALVSGKFNTSLCSHFAYIGTSGVNDTDDIGFSLFSASQFGCRCPKSVANTVNEFKAWLAQQYANGTPVCVWYILATPTTGIVNEPIRKIGEYADTVSGISIPTTTGKDTFDVETTLKPSEVSLTYTGWHDASVKEWDGSEWS